MLSYRSYRSPPALCFSQQDACTYLIASCSRVFVHARVSVSLPLFSSGQGESRDCDSRCVLRTSVHVPRSCPCPSLWENTRIPASGLACLCMYVRTIRVSRVLECPVHSVFSRRESICISAACPVDRKLVDTCARAPTSPPPPYLLESTLACRIFALTLCGYEHCGNASSYFSCSFRLWSIPKAYARQSSPVV